ncbi:MAG TPA: cell wall-binding repeat-containing protein [Nitriliruptorales bacterium]|nr:cell wall-binding repeat-containing protein [Nitriliruptorales bacterium]
MPPDGALLGAYVDPDGRWSGVEAAKQDVRSLEQRLGRTLAIDHHFYAWTDAFPGPLERWDVEQGRIPLVTWEPWGTDLQSIASGAHDALIRQRAREVAAFGADVMLRLAHEMNGDWYPWSGDRNGGGTTGPQRYVAAWRRVHDLFEAEGATNAVWVWAPNHVDVPQEPWNQWTSYYPGDAHVDWVGIDAYNWGRSQPWSSWTALADLIAPLYGDYAARKPLMVSETSSTEVGGDKAAWIAQARSDLKQRFPSVAGLVWFHVDKEQDWRIDSSTAAFSAFRDLAHDPYFSGSSGGVKVLGGRAAVSDAVVAEVGRVSGVQPQRLSGPDRYATAAAVVADAFPGRVPVVYVATGEAFADALAGSAAAAVVDGPVLLVGHDHVPSATARQLDRSTG